MQIIHKQNIFYFLTLQFMFLHLQKVDFLSSTYIIIPLLQKSMKVKCEKLFVLWLFITVEKKEGGEHKILFTVEANLLLYFSVYSIFLLCSKVP